MFKKFRFLTTITVNISLAFVFLMTGTVHAQDTWPPQPQDTDPFWHVAYWNNTALSGEPIVQTTDTDINHDWGYGSPHSSVNADHFSARWKHYIDTDTGNYRFTVTSDDGVRVYVDDRLIIDQWHDHAPQTYTTDVNLTDGHHLVTVEYYENEGGAVAKLSWASAPTTFHGWRGEYFTNRYLDGSPALIRDDAGSTGIDFNWGYGSPDSSIPSDGFSVRWTRTLNFAAGSYRFTATSDDGVRLWVNDHLLIDKWLDQPFTSYADTIYVSGDVPIKMEYYENGGAAAARLTWTKSGGPSPTPAGTVIVDDTDPGFVRGGLASGWRTVAEGYNGRQMWTRNNDWRRPNYNWARWYPDLAPGRYEVFVYIPERYTTTSNARYWVSHRDGFTLRQVNQSTTGSRWISLGTYWFRGNSNDYASLADVTYEPYVSRLISFDAVKWEPR
jgi:hypothetical protein